MTLAPFRLWLDHARRSSRPEALWRPAALAWGTRLAVPSLRT